MSILSDLKECFSEDQIDIRDDRHYYINDIKLSFKHEDNTLNNVGVNMKMKKMVEQSIFDTIKKEIETIKEG